MTERPVSAVDSLWLHMDTPHNLMTIEGVMTTSEPLDIERVSEVISNRLPERYPVFREIPARSHSPLGGDVWVPAPDFDVRNHIRVDSLPAPGDDAALQAFVSARMSEPLDRSKPLWEIHLLDGYKDGSAIVARFHHALADGTALARVLVELTDDHPDDDLAEAGRLAETGAENVGPSHPLVGITRRLDGMIGGESDGVRHSLLEAVDNAADSLTDTAKSGYRVARTVANPDRLNDALAIVGTTPTLVDKMFLTRLPENPLHGDVGLEKRAVWSTPHDLEQIKRAGAAQGATINDIMVAAVAGTLRRHTLDRGGAPLDMSTMVPVNLRPLNRPLPRELGNKFALVVLKLPLSGESSEVRLARTKAGMDSIKSSPEAMVTFGIINTLGHISKGITESMVSFFSAKGIGVTTNVPGPRNTRYIAGSRVSTVLGWAPGAGNQGINECIFSYDGKIQVGFKVDATLVPDAESLVEAFDAELEELTSLNA